MEIKFIEIGESIGTRFLGEQMRLKIEEAMEGEDLIVFDFTDVKLVSHSFADECFGKLLLRWSLADLKSKTTFRNTPPFIKKTIAFTFQERLTTASAV